MKATRSYPRTLARFSDMADRAIVPFVFVLFFVSGFAALLYQVIWQRVLALFSGADVYSITIIVAAFMAGLGCGSLAGGYLADKVSIGWRIVLFSGAELAIALFALVSKSFYYDLLYLQWNQLASSPIVLALVLFASLLWPTFFMGMSLPLLAKTLTRRVQLASRMVGALYGLNTLGAAVGAFLTTWVFSRAIGFEGTIMLGAALNAFCGLGALIVSPYFLSNHNQVSATLAENRTGARGEQEEVVATSFMFPVPVWIAIYGVSGFVALSLEIVWFRLLGVMIKSTAFTFGNLLAIFLAGLAVGTFKGIEVARESKNPARLFLLLQAGITIYAAVSLVALIAALGNLPALEILWSYFGLYDHINIGTSLSAIGQFVDGQFMPDVEGKALTFLLLYFVVPIGLIGPPTLMMGLSFPLLQQVVQHDVAFLGRRVGWLQTANIFGSMLGAVLTGLVLLRFLGTSLTIRSLLIFGGFFLALLIYISFTRLRLQRRIAAGAVTASVLLLFWLVPNSSLLWAKLHGTTESRIIYGEDGSGLALMKNENELFSGITDVYSNGLGQSSLPFPDHHIMLGMLPTMVHPNPEDIAIIGLGSGATLFGAGGREETRQITSIEIVAPQLDNLRELNTRQAYGGITALLADERIKYEFTDGRSFVMLGGKKYDIIEADALRPSSAYAGNLYSREYFTLLKEHLKTGGFAVTWVPTNRVRETFLSVFPHMLEYGALSNVLIGSNEPLVWDIEAIEERLRSRFTEDYFGRADIDLGRFLEVFQSTEPIMYGPDFNRSDLINLNSDLFPKDEYMVP